MRSILVGSTLLAAALYAAPVLAQDAPASDFTITGGATLTSDYRFRGISQTDKNPAIQGTLGVSHSSGFYVGTWGSSIDDYVAAGSDQEIDLYAGYKKTYDGTTVDVGLLYYYYPGPSGNTDFFEPYANVSRTFGPVTAKAGLNYSWKQHALSCGLCSSAREDNLYTYAELSGGIPGTGVSLTGHLGENWGRSYLTAGLKNYTDWSLTAAYTWKNLTFSVAYVDTDFKKGEAVDFSGKNVAKGGVVAAIGVAF
ncbi:TorF family putative porin [Sphingomonas sp. BIUV-7]|uniref:TorF family putative porin n=1 Tax=Sphingomonas natans TaxID=3063330 RepID=A0ABT8Y649_9SPHN|nr:TorF family putative porin [Sphingomonas sp. BIUV-7]MDO6413791.1 TorF family putative porin [Sphingomonas sp. BIUV-7]